eukprot:199091-Chlamydomonas_euryale.AAC.2
MSQGHGSRSERAGKVWVQRGGGRRGKVWVQRGGGRGRDAVKTGLASGGRGQGLRCVRVRGGLVGLKAGRLHPSSRRCWLIQVKTMSTCTASARRADAGGVGLQSFAPRGIS